MIEYYKGAYGLNLLARAHGSAVYKAIIPGVLSIVVYLLFEGLWLQPVLPASAKPIRHPYAIGVLVSSVSFIIIFRANNSYQRYWEGCGAVHQMMSKWLDAVIHTGIYHLQCSHFDSIKPPTYFDNQDLNRYHLTRDRERQTDAVSSGRSTRDEQTTFLRKRKVQKSIEYVGATKKPKGWFKDSEEKRRIAKPSSAGVELHAGSDRNWASDPNECGSAHLLGKGRLDGGWGLLFADDVRGPTGTFYSMDSREPFMDKANPRDDGFSSTRGGRTPDLFLQELAHLASLAVAVSFCTLRNDVEGAVSPLDMYHPGQKWPEADPDKLPKEKTGVPTWLMVKHFKYWFGMDRTVESRTAFNASRPMPVIGGVSENEIAFLQKARGASAKTTLAWGWLSEFIIREHLAGSLGAVGPPIISRIFQFLSDGMIFYNHARKIMFIPFPFPHAQLTSFFTLTLIFTVPLLMDEYTNVRWLGSILTFLTVTCLNGLHEVARELENPFRNVPNDVPLCTLLAMFNESLITMYAGYHPDQYWDADRVRKNWERQKSAEFESGEKEKEDEDDNAAAESAHVSNKSKSKSVDVPQSAESGKALVELQDMIQKQAQEIERLREMVESREGNAIADDSN